MTEAVWLNEGDVCSARQLVDVSGLTDAELNELIATGVILAIDENAEPKSFALRSIVTATVARRLRDDFELDLNGLSLALTLMRRIDELQEQLQAARAERSS